MQLLVLIQLTIVLVDTGSEAVRISTESDVEILEELITTCQQAFWGVRSGFDARLTIEDDDSVGEICGHDEIVLNNESGFLGVHDEPFDDAGGDDTLLGVKIGAWLIDEVDICWNTQGKNDSNTLQFTAREILHFLVDEVVELKGLVDIRLELRAQESGLDFLEEKLSDGACELGRDLLGLHRNVHRGHGGSAVWFLCAGKHSAEGSLPSPVLAHHDDDFGICKFAWLDLQVKIAQSLLHGWIVKAMVFLAYEVVTRFGDTECEGFFAEAQVLGWDVAIEEDIDAFANRLRQCDDAIHGRSPIEYTNKVREIVEDRQIVLNHNDIVVRTQQTTNDPCSAQPLFDIEIRRWLIEHVA